MPAGDAADDPVLSGEAGAPTKMSDSQYIYAWIGWDAEFDNIIAPLDVHATFHQILRQYNVRFKISGMIIQDTLEYYGTYATFNGDETAIKKIINGTPSDYYEFAGWSPDLSIPVTGPTEYYA